MNYPLRDDKNGALMVGALGNGALSNGTVVNGNRPYETHPGLVRGHFHHHHHHHQFHPSFHETPSWHIKDEVLPQVVVHDEFDEWPNGYVHKVYGSCCPDAKSHQSGWAMRNTNNHDPKRLKKSCLGVMVCNRNCVSDDGFMVHVRPFICDKARRRQEKSPCPTKGCEGRLVQLKCKGHSGKPVTHIWRTEGKSIFFQARGEHDHPQPKPKMSINARRMIDSKNRLIQGIGRTVQKRNGARRNRVTNDNFPLLKQKKLREINWNFTHVTNHHHYGSGSGGGVLRGLPPSVAPDSNQLQASQSSTARFNRTVVAATVLPYLSVDDCPQPLAQPLWPSDCPDLGLGLPGHGTGFDGTVVPCRGGDAFLPIGELRDATMMVNAPSASEYFPDLSGGIEHPGHVPASLFFPPSAQSGIPCDPGMVVHGDGQYRYPAIGGEMLFEDGANMGHAQRPDDFYFNDGSTRALLPPPKWSTSDHMTSSSIHQLTTASTTASPYYQSLQCRPQQQQQQHQTSMKTQHSDFLSPFNNSTSPSSISTSSSDLLPLFVLTSTTTATGVYNEYQQQQQQQQHQHQQQHTAIFQLQ